MKPADEWDDDEKYGDLTDEEWIKMIQVDAWNSAMERVLEGLRRMRDHILDKSDRPVRKNAYVANLIRLISENVRDLRKKQK